jgi:sec-independent protein translocase protein TatA
MALSLDLLIRLSLVAFTLTGERIETMFDISGSELLIVLVIVVLLFGPGRLARTMGEIGKGLRSFKESLSPAEKPDPGSDTDTPSK